MRNKNRNSLKSTALFGGASLIAASLLQGTLLASQPQLPSGPVKITLLGLNDLHGNIEEKTVTVGTAPGTQTVKVGGAKTIAAYFDIARQENPRTLVLDAGDAYQGTLLSNTFEGLPVVRAYNEIGVDASTFGNHEFDFGDLNGKPAGSPADAQGAMKSLLSEVKFKYLTSNISIEGMGKGRRLKGFPGVRPSAIFNLQGVKVGVIGATTESTPREAAPTNLKGLVFNPMAASVLKQSQVLRRAGAQVVVVLAHAGGKCDMSQPAAQGDKACASDKPDEITAMLDALPAGTVDAVLAGHVHTAQAHFIRGVPVVQTFGFGNSFSRVDLWVNPAARADAPASDRISKVEISKPTYFCHTHFANYASCAPEEAKLGGAYPADLGVSIPATYMGHLLVPRVQADAVLATFQAQTKALIEKFIVELPGDLSHDRTAESPISNCVADAIHEQIEFETGRPIDTFISHSGGIRAPMPKHVRFGEVFSVLPFDGAMAIATLNGAELEEFGRIQSLTPKSISVLSNRGWKVVLDKNVVFPRHRGYLTPGGTPTVATQNYVILTEEFNVLPGGQTDALLAKARAEGRIEILPRLSRDVFADRLSRPAPLPASCLGGPLDRTIFQ